MAGYSGLRHAKHEPADGAPLSLSEATSVVPVKVHLQPSANSIAGDELLRTHQPQVSITPTPPFIINSCQNCMQIDTPCPYIHQPWYAIQQELSWPGCTSVMICSWRASHRGRAARSVENKHSTPSKQHSHSHTDHSKASSYLRVTAYMLKAVITWHATTRS